MQNESLGTILQLILDDIFISNTYRVMKRVLKSIIFLLVTMLITSSCAVKSTVSIRPQEEFVLGEYQNTRFNAKVTNLSTKEVKVVILNTLSGKQTQGFGLAAKGTAQIYVSKEETVIFKNASGEQVRVKVRLGRDVEGMRYQPITKR